MRHFFITLYLLGISLFSSAQQEEKVALLITHYAVRTLRHVLDARRRDP